MQKSQQKHNKISKVEDNSGSFSRRIILLLIASLLLSALLTVVIFYSTVRYLSKSNYSNSQAEEAAFLAEKSAERYLGELDNTTYQEIMNTSSNLLDSVIMVYMYKDNVFNINYTSDIDKLPENFIEDAKGLIKEYNYAVMDQRMVSFSGNLGESKAEYLFVAYPIVIVNNDNSETIGVVYIINALSRIRDQLTNLNFSLVFASALTFILVLLPLLYILKQLIRPFSETKDVALALSEGDFSKRAKETNDEIGDLAKSINYLADRLDETLSNLTNERNRLVQVINALGEGIFAVKANMEIMHINPAMYELYNLDNFDEEDASKEILKIPGFEENLKKVITTRESITMKHKHRDRIMSINIDCLVNNENHAYGAVALFRDITEAEKLERTRKDYISNISHELRTPLTAIQALVEPLDDNLVKKESDKHRYYKIILNETARLSRLINDMMALSRLQSGEVNLEPERINAKEFYSSIKYKYNLQMQAKGIEFKIEANLDKVPDLYINADRLEQIIVIILDNAMKYTKAGGSISLGFEADKKAENSIVMYIKDTGVGIAEEDLNQVFERFYKTNKARGRSEGTGLGLSLAKEMVDLMGERIWVKSKLNVGTVFYMSIGLYKGETNN